MPTSTNRTTKPTTEIRETHVRAIVKVKTNLSDIPLNATFHDLGLTNAQLLQVQTKLIRTFNRTVGTIFFSDTIYTITQRLNGKNKY